LLDADDEAKWDAAFAESGDKLDRLAETALSDFRAGRMTPLDDPEKLSLLTRHPPFGTLIGNYCPGLKISGRSL
jgi:hypothetical protein